MKADKAKPWRVGDVIRQIDCSEGNGCILISPAATLPNSRTFTFLILDIVFPSSFVYHKVELKLLMDDGEIMKANLTIPDFYRMQYSSESLDGLTWQHLYYSGTDEI